MNSPHPESISIERGEVEDIPGLHELWLELHHHHARVGAAVGPYVDDDSSWAVRSSSYREWLSDPRSLLLLARDGSGLIGYALVRVMEAGADLRDSWQVPNVVAELETLIVAERARGAGLGTRLLDEVDAELEQLGIEELMVGLIPGNDGAKRLYERRGFKPRWLGMVRRPAR
jgi:ribosomal protein S18 acetylase RimI-like enzyme